MIDKQIYELDYIRKLQRKYSADPGLIERALYAFGLLEAIKSVGMPFCFKGGTCLMLILDNPARLSTDIDILVEPGTDVDGYIERASKIFPFINKQEDVRKGKNGVEKRHFKFTYFSPARNTEFYAIFMLTAYEYNTDERSKRFPYLRRDRHYPVIRISKVADIFGVNVIKA